jgi:hypothetical protein
MTWGSNWGVNWGGANNARLFALSSAIASTVRSVVVTFTDTPLVSSSLGTNDGANSDTWTVVDIDTGVESTIVAISQLDTYRVQLTVQSPWVANHTYKVTAASIVSTSGDTVASPGYALFDAMASSKPAVRNVKKPLVDFYNAPTPKSPAGTLVVGSSGDYRMMSDSDLIRKLILRRISTRRGGFKWLPNYGSGRDAKDLMPTSELVKAKAAYDLQIAQEPEVDVINSKLTLSKDGILVLSVQAKLKNSNDVVPLDFALSGGQ